MINLLWADRADCGVVRWQRAKLGTSTTSVHRYFKLFGLQPHRVEARKPL